MIGLFDRVEVHGYGLGLSIVRQIAEKLGDLRVVNTVLIGAASPHLPIDLAYWKKAIEQRVPPKALEVNLAAFEKGREL